MSAGRLSSSHRLGRVGEDVAVDLLSQAGYEILERNRRFGGVEVDIVALDTSGRHSVLILCEVKTRTGSAYGLPSEAVDGRKQYRLRRAAGAYLAERGVTLGHPACRFDVVEIVVEGDVARCRHIKDAF